MEVRGVSLSPIQHLQLCEPSADRELDLRTLQMVQDLVGVHFLFVFISLQWIAIFILLITLLHFFVVENPLLEIWQILSSAVIYKLSVEAYNTANKDDTVKTTEYQQSISMRNLLILSGQKP